jgi:tetratricopeptide (TPR) repeat protein
MRAAAVLGLLLLALSAPAQAAPAAHPEGEPEARAAFVAGHYAEALARYQKLYDDTHHPTYLRNLGRCHQMLKDPDPAIASFREYLRIAPNLPATARDEVEGYIRDMQELKRQRGEAVTPAIVSGTVGGFPNPPAMGSGVRSSPAPDAIPPVAHLDAAPPAPPPPSKHTWPWIAGGALVVAAGVVTAVLLSQSPPSACSTCTLPKVSIDTR